MRAIARISLILAFAGVCAFAQRHGGFGGGMRGGGGVGVGRGFGGVGIGRGFGGVGIGRGFGGVHIGGGIGFAGRGFFGNRLGYFGAGYWPYYGGLGYWPMFSGFYDSGYVDSPYINSYAAPSPNVTVVYAPPAPQPTIPVYVTQPARPVIRDYSDGGYGLPEPSELKQGTISEPPIYLIAFKDQVIRPSVAYWVDKNTLHYVTLDRQEKQAPLDTVDRAMSNRLNRERRVAFRLPE